MPQPEDGLAEGTGIWGVACLQISSVQQVAKGSRSEVRNGCKANGEGAFWSNLNDRNDDGESGWQKSNRGPKNLWQV